MYRFLWVFQGVFVLVSGLVLCGPIFQSFLSDYLYSRKSPCRLDTSDTPPAPEVTGICDMCIDNRSVYSHIHSYAPGYAIRHPPTLTSSDILLGRIYLVRQDGTCVVGLQLFATVPLLSYDL